MGLADEASCGLPRQRPRWTTLDRPCVFPQAEREITMLRDQHTVLYCTVLYCSSQGWSTSLFPPYHPAFELKKADDGDFFMYCMTVTGSSSPQNGSDGQRSLSLVDENLHHAGEIPPTDLVYKRGKFIFLVVALSLLLHIDDFEYPILVRR